MTSQVMMNSIPSKPPAAFVRFKTVDDCNQASLLVCGWWLSCFRCMSPPRRCFRCAGVPSVFEYFIGFRRHTPFTLESAPPVEPPERLEGWRNFGGGRRRRTERVSEEIYLKRSPNPKAQTVRKLEEAGFIRWRQILG